ncbi:MAG: VOC family protein [Actinomycetales bacterium]
MKLEVVVVPVADVDRAKDFYQGLGWRLDADFPFDNGFRVVQFTPPGSGCSIQFGTNITPAAPGSAEGLYLVVSDIDAARKELAALGTKISEVFHAGTELPTSATTTPSAPARRTSTLRRAAPPSIE